MTDVSYIQDDCYRLLIATTAGVSLGVGAVASAWLYQVLLTLASHIPNTLGILFS